MLMTVKQSSIQKGINMYLALITMIWASDAAAAPGLAAVGLHGGVGVQPAPSARRRAGDALGAR